MSELQRLTGELQTLLKVKIDAQVEGAVHHARTCGIGVSESLALLLVAVVRELKAHGLRPEQVGRMWAEAMESVRATQRPGGATGRLN